MYTSKMDVAKHKYKGEWCWVDADQCQRAYELSGHFTNVTVAGAPLAYSYATCGYLDTFTSTPREQVLEFLASIGRSKLRIGMPSDSGSGYTLVGSKTYEDGTPKVPRGGGVGGTNRSGSYAVFVDDLLRIHGIEWEEAPISGRSKEFSPSSSWTACVHEVG